MATQMMPAARIILEAQLRMSSVFIRVVGEVVHWSWRAKDSKGPIHGADPVRDS
jgi:hypothetical protein